MPRDVPRRHDGHMGHRWNEWYATAERNHAVLLADTAARLGISRQAIRRRTRQADLRPLTRDAWLVPGVRPSLEARAVATTRTAGRDAVASHLTAAWLLGILPRPRSIRLDRPIVHVTIPHERRIRPIAHTTVHRSRQLDPADVAIVDRIAVTSPARTLRDLANSLPDVRLRHACTDAEQRRQVTIADLEAQAQQRRPAPGGARFRRIVAVRRADATQSALESEALVFLRDHGWEVAVDHPVRCRDGVTVHVDLAIVAHRVAIECDGLGYHADRPSFEVDRVRWSQLKRVGWELVWVTRDRLDHRRADLLDELHEATETPIPATHATKPP